MEGYRTRERSEKLNDREAVWVYEKIGGQWQSVQVPLLDRSVLENREELDRRDHNLIRMLRETDEKWNLSSDDGKEEGVHQHILRHHPRYKELFKTWAIRWLRQSTDEFQFNPEISADGEILDMYGQPTGRKLVNEVESGRFWIDEQVEHELRISEGFVDETPDGEDPRDLAFENGLHPQWWMLNKD